jgi:vacuolar-type H+-ATPase subunit C/Vma6
MSVVVDSYPYTLIKISSLKSLLIPDDDFIRLKRISEINKLVNALDEFYPGLSSSIKDEEPDIMDVERELYTVFYSIFEKTYTASPFQLRNFLRSLLFRYEIWNLKTLIAGTLANMDREAIEKEIVMKPENLLQRDKFMKDLIKQEDISGILRLLKKSRYARIIERGYYYFDQTKEIFLLEALLDKFFIESINETISEYSGKEKYIFRHVVNILIQKYNLMLIYRSLRNQVPKDLIIQLIIPIGDIFTPTLLMEFANSKDNSDFFAQLREFIQSKKIFKKQYDKLKDDSDSDLITHIFSILNKRIFEKLVVMDISNIDTLTIKWVLSFIFRKENEIYRVLGLFVKLKYKRGS